MVSRLILFDEKWKSGLKIMTSNWSCRFWYFF